MLVVDNIYKTFHLDNNPENDKRALQGVSLTIGEGDFVTVIGSNGSGKTTLLNSISGLYPVDSGRIILDDQDITKKKDYQRAKYVGRVFQDPMQGTIADMTLFENLSIASRRAKKTSPFRWALSSNERERFKDLLRPLGLGLEDRLDTPMGTFSGGQRQAVTLLMASMSNPKILLLDEHTAALDPKTAKTIMKLTDKIIRETKTPALMITHNMKDAIKYGNRLIMMDGGKIIFDCRGEEKEKLTIEDLVKLFSSIGDVPDSTLLSN